MSLSKERKDKNMGRSDIFCYPNQASLRSDNNMAEGRTGFFYFKLFLSCFFDCGLLFNVHVFSTFFTHFVESILKYKLTLTCWFSFVLFSSPEPKAHRWAYSIPMVRRPSVVRQSIVVHNFKHLLLWNRLANQSQILCGALLGRRKESLLTESWSHDQDGRHTHIW